MTTKNLTAEQVRKLGDFTAPFIKDGECYAEAAIRRIEELEKVVKRIEELENKMQQLERFNSVLFIDSSIDNLKYTIENLEKDIATLKNNSTFNLFR